MKRRLAAGIILLTVWATSMHGFADEIPFAERFALAADREVALRQLIPGTEDYYYYHCLHFQHLQQFEKVGPLLSVWVERYQATPRFEEIRNRQALLTYQRDARASLEHLRHQIGLRFDHQRRTRDEELQLPTELAPASITLDMFLQRALAGQANLQQVEDSALAILLQRELSREQRRELLARIDRPDAPRLLPLVLQDLQDGVGFGSYPIHGQLLLAQLDELRKTIPGLTSNQNFVQTYLARLVPGPDESLETAGAVREAYFRRLREFVDPLPSGFNSLKAQVLYQQLRHDRQRGVHDRDIFLRYLALPRSLPYVRPEYFQQQTRQEPVADLQSSFSPHLPWGPVGNDEPLVRAYLSHFFVDATNYDEFREFIKEEYLREVFAETKLVLGLGDAERYLSWLTPAAVQQLRDRVDLDFATTNRQIFSLEDPIRLELFVKNVPTLIVKVFEINSANFYRENQREIDTDINLDGLTPNWEQTYRYDTPPLRREKREFEFPELNQRGVYIIDFIGSGRSSRVVIRRGGLRHLSETTTTGQVVKVLDQDNQHLPDATLELNGRVFTSNQRGEILIPFSTEPGEKTIILGDGRFHTLERFSHAGEDYQLRAGIYVDRENLLDGRQAQVMVRASLFAGRLPISLSVLKNVRMRVTATDHDGVPTSMEVDDFRLYEDRETAFPLQVPPRLSQVEFRLTAEVTPRTKTEDVRLEVVETFTLNGLDVTQAVDALQLMRTDEGYFVELLGRTGEPRPGLPIRIQLKHRGFRNQHSVMLKSDSKGRVRLGKLDGIESIQATPRNQPARTWSLVDRRQSFLPAIHGVVGRSLEIPYPGLTDEDISREAFSLLELRGEQFLKDHFDSLSVEEGSLRLRDLPAGEYDLLLREFGRRIRIRMVDGASWQGHVLGKRRILEAREPRPARIAKVETDNEVVRVQLGQVDPFTRVHVVATRYVPEFDIYEKLAAVRDAELAFRRYAPLRSTYVEGRNIGDEYRYIIERKYHPKFPGNMLARPSLLLNPWAVHDTVTSQQTAAEGDAFAARGAPAPSSMEAEGTDDQRMLDRVPLGGLDFLARTSVTLLNLRADSRGVIELEREEFGDRQHLHLVLVHPRSTSYLQIALEDTEAGKLDRRLAESLDSEKHFIHERQVRLVDVGQAFTLDDVASARFEIYDSREKVFALYATLVDDKDLTKFQWLLQWHTFDDAKKLELYSEHVCHEVDFFLRNRDEAFFERVAVPYLRQKREKQFLDHWLLGNDLSDYQRPARYARLNAAERILLAERLGDRAMLARELEHELEIRKPDLAKEAWFFEAAIAGAALRQSDVKMQLGMELAAMEDSAPQRAAGLGRAQAGFGMGGMGGGIASMPGPDARKLAEPQSRMRRDMRRGGSPEQLFVAPADRLSRSELGDDDAEEKALRELFRPLDQTREWAETHYYRQRMEDPAEGRVPNGLFWRDYARHEPGTPFVSLHFAEPTNDLTEALLALAILDLPAVAAEHELQFEKGRLTLKPGSPLLVLFEEIQAVEAELDGSEILVNQLIYRPSERGRNQPSIDGSESDGAISHDECLVHEVHGCQVVITNSSSQSQTLDLLLQIPQGAIPLVKGRATGSRRLKLAPFETHKLDYFFYFPQPGTFTHYPVQVSRDQKVVAAAAPRELKAVTRLSQQNRQSWEYISQQGTEDEVLGFLREGNLRAVELSDLAWRMKDRELFRKTTELLQTRRMYAHTLWSYAVFHDELQRIRTFLEMSPGFLAKCGPYLESPLVTIDPEERRAFEHLEYRPLVNQRAHPLAGNRKILNDRFFQQYRRLMDILSCRRELDDRDRMSVVYYLLLQDRIDEGQQLFAKIDPERLDTRLQYDYCAAYLDFFQPDPKRARTIAARYLEYPVASWRKMFAAIGAKLEELDGADTVAVESRDRDQQQTQLAAAGESVELNVESGQLTITHQNVETLTVNFYAMDIELLFSRNPFVQGQTGQFSWIRPHLTESVAVDAGQSELTIPLPDELRNRNVLVEVKGREVRRWQPYYANSLRVQLHSDYGQLRVMDEASGQPLSTVYVKVYARLRDGQIVFHKDGYTDLRGRFDYASLSTNQLDQVQQFALLILSEEQGAEVRETEPPAR